MSIPQPKHRISFLAYLKAEENADFKSEFYDGEIYAMSGGTRSHSLIATNLCREAGNQLKGKDCWVFNSDLKVRIEAADAAAYPDGMVICGETAYWEDRQDVVTNPVLVFEVLSKGTALWDRSGKFRRYEKLATLKEYVLVEQNEPQIDVYFRTQNGNWTLERFEGLAAWVELNSLSIRIPMAEIYSGVKFRD